MEGSQSGWAVLSNSAGTTAFAAVIHGKTCGGPQNLEVGELRPQAWLYRKQKAPFLCDKLETFPTKDKEAIKAADKIQTV